MRMERMERMELLWGQQDQDPATGMGFNSRLGAAPCGLSCCSHPVPAVPPPGIGDPPRWAQPHGATTMTTAVRSPWHGPESAFLQPSDAAQPPSTGMPAASLPRCLCRAHPLGCAGAVSSRARRGTPDLCFAAQTHPWHLWDHRRRCSLGPPSGRHCLGPQAVLGCSGEFWPSQCSALQRDTDGGGRGGTQTLAPDGTHEVGRDRDGLWLWAGFPAPWKVPDPVSPARPC